MKYILVLGFLFTPCISFAAPLYSFSISGTATYANNPNAGELYSQNAVSAESYPAGTVFYYSLVSKVNLGAPEATNCGLFDITNPSTPLNFNFRTVNDGAYHTIIASSSVSGGEVTAGDIIQARCFGDNSLVFSGDGNQAYLIIDATSTQYLPIAPASPINPNACNLFVNNISTAFLNLDFSWSDCLYFLFYPDPTLFSGIWNSAQSGFLAAVPWGYIQAVVIDMQASSTSALPNFTISAPPTVNGHQFPIVATLNLNVFGNLPTATSSPFYNATSTSGATFRSTVEPYWDTVVVLAFIVWLLSIILGVELYSHNAFGHEGSLSDTGKNDDSYRLKEYFYKNRPK